MVRRGHIYIGVYRIYAILYFERKHTPSLGIFDSGLKFWGDVEMQ